MESPTAMGTLRHIVITNGELTGKFLSLFSKRREYRIKNTYPTTAMLVLGVVMLISWLHSVPGLLLGMQRGKRKLLGLKVFNVSLIAVSEYIDTMLSFHPSFVGARYPLTLNVFHSGRNGCLLFVHLVHYPAIAGYVRGYLGATRRRNDRFAPKSGLSVSTVLQSSEFSTFFALAFLLRLLERYDGRALYCRSRVLFRYSGLFSSRSRLDWPAVDFRNIFSELGRDHAVCNTIDKLCDINLQHYVHSGPFFFRDSSLEMSPF
jgi:hypothetical protein